MSGFQDVAPIYIDHFVMEMKLAYQSMGLNLPNTALLITDFTGDNFFYPKMGVLTAKDIALGQQVDPQTAKLEQIPGLLTPSSVEVLLDSIALTFTNVSLRAALVKSLSMAMSRKMDDELITEVTDSTDPEITDEPDAGLNLTKEKIQRANQLFNARSVPTTDRVLLIGAQTDSLLMVDPNFINNEFFNKGAVASGSFNGSTIYGFLIKVVADATPGDPNGALKKVGDVVTCLAYHKASVGYAKGMSTRISITEESLFRNAFLIQSKMTLDSIVLDGRGIVRIGADVTP